MNRQKRIPNKLKKYRRITGFSQKDVAEILEFKRTNKISSWEKGKQDPCIENLLKLSVLYSTLPAELYSDLYWMIREKVVASRNKFFLKKQKNPMDDS